MKATKPLPFAFGLDQLYSVEPTVRPMFGCHTIYVRNKIVPILRKRKDHKIDNGVWIATAFKYHKTLKEVFPHMRSNNLFGGKESK